MKIAALLLLAVSSFGQLHQQSHLQGKAETVTFTRVDHPTVSSDIKMLVVNPAQFLLVQDRAGKEICTCSKTYYEFDEPMLACHLENGATWDDVMETIADSY